MTELRAGNREADGSSARRQQQSAPPELFPAGQRDRPGGWIDPLDPRPDAQLDAALPVELIRPEREPLLAGVPGQEILRQVRAIHRAARLAVEEHHAALVSFFAQGLGRDRASSSGAHDHD